MLREKGRQATMPTVLQIVREYFNSRKEELFIASYPHSMIASRKFEFGFIHQRAELVTKEQLPSKEKTRP